MLTVFDLIGYGADKVQLFLLLTMRIGGIMLTAPVFSHNSIPRRIAVAITLILALVLMPLLVNTPVPQSLTLIELVLLCLKEVIFGVLIGLVFNLVLLGVRLAGSIVSYQIGFAMANVVDPNSSEQVSVIGEIWFMIATLIFLCLNGHHVIISGLADSFRAVPMGTTTLTGPIGEWFIKYSALVFVLAVKLAAPVIMTVFLVEVAMGVLARTMPQMNIFIVGFPLKIFTGLLMLGLSLPVFAYVLTKICANLDNELARLMHLFQARGAS